MVRVLRNGFLIVVVLILSTGFLMAGGTPEPAAESTGVTLTGLTNYDGRVEADAEAQAFIYRRTAFLENNPDVTIDEEVLSYNDMVTKSRTLAAANQLPHFFKVGGDVVATLAAGGAISSIDYIFEAYPEYRDIFLDGVFENFQHNGQLYAVPVRLSAHTVFYNREMLRAVGFNSFPETWDEFDRLVNALNREYGSNRNFRPVALGSRATWIVNNIFSHMTLQNAGLEWYQNLVAGNGAAWTDAPVVEVATRLRQMVENRTFNTDLGSIDQNQQRALYYSGNAAMFFSGNWAIGFIHNEAPQEIIDATGVASFPEFTNGRERNVVAGGAGWGMGINHRDDPAVREALGRFITQVIDLGYGQRMAELGAIPPTRLDEGSYDSSRLNRIARETNELVGSLNVLPVMDHKLPAAMMQSVASEVQLLLIGEVTPVQFAANLQRAWDAIQ